LKQALLFLKKKKQKNFYLFWGFGVGTAKAPTQMNQKFFGYFFSKK